MQFLTALYKLGSYTKTSENQLSLITDSGYDSTILLGEESTSYGWDIHYDGSGTNDLLFRRYEGSPTPVIALYLDRSNGYVGVGTGVPTYKFSIYSTNQTDQIGIYHDNTDAYFTTDDGEFIFKTDEGTDTNTYLTVEGKGTGFGVVRAYDNDAAEWAQMYCASGWAYFVAGGSNPLGMHLANTADYPIHAFFSASAGETPEFRISGYRTGDAKRTLVIGISDAYDDTALFDGVSNYLFDGMVRQATIWHAYGGFEDEGETITCGVGDWNHITNAGNDLWNIDEADGITESGDVFTITNAGDYEGVLSLSISGLNTKDFHVRVYNNTQTAVMGRPIGQSTTGANNEVNICVPIYIEADAGDEFEFQIMSGDGADPVVEDAILKIIYLHD